MKNKFLEKQYKEIVSRAVKLKIMKRKEWNDRFKTYRDECGHSFVHYLECIRNKIDVFLTTNPIMLRNRNELQERFGVRIASPEELHKELHNNENGKKCPYCDYVGTEHENIDGKKNPIEGDISFCINCGEISQFKNNKLIKTDLNSLDESTKREINDIRVAWLRTKAISNVKRG